jgi:CheY-like chemotaxis protein
MTTSRTILLVEDNEDDIFLMGRALKGAGVLNPLQVVDNGQDAINYLAGAGKFADRTLYPIPAVVFLDLKLPGKSGIEVLGWIRAQKEFEAIIVIVLTSSAEPRDLKACYALGANSYLVKPPTPEQLVEMARSFKWYWLEFNRYAAVPDPAPGS